MSSHNVIGLMAFQTGVSAVGTLQCKCSQINDYACKRNNLNMACDCSLILTGQQGIELPLALQNHGFIILCTLCFINLVLIL